MNRVILTGRIVRDSERIETEAGKVLWRFSVAVNSGGRDNERVDFFDCEYWTDVGVEMDLRKGQLVMINGRLKQSRWEDGGIKKSRVVIVVQALWGIKSVRDYNHQPETEEVSDDGLPF